MKLNKKQFAEYIRKNGITKARLSEGFRGTPKNTELWFALWHGEISTYDEDTKNKNKEFGYEWLFDTYKGKFIIDDEEMKKEMKNKIVLESNTELKDNTISLLFGGVHNQSK